MDKKLFTSFCFQGQLFLLETLAVLSHDWLLKTLITTDLPTAKIEDSFYLDCDGNSFRVIYAILSGVTTVEEQATLPLRDLKLLLSTARYVSCMQLSEEIKNLIDSTSNEVNRLEALLQNEVSTISSLRIQLQEKSSSLENLQREFNDHKMIGRKKCNDCGQIIQIIGDVAANDVVCRGYKTRRTSNICNTCDWLIYANF